MRDEKDPLVRYPDGRISYEKAWQGWSLDPARAMLCAPCDLTYEVSLEDCTSTHKLRDTISTSATRATTTRSRDSSGRSEPSWGGPRPSRRVGGRRRRAGGPPQSSSRTLTDAAWRELAMAAERAEAEAKWIRQVDDDLGIQHPPNMLQEIALKDLYDYHTAQDQRGWHKTVEMLLKLERIRQDQ